jgi:hypothetical protein
MSQRTKVDTWEMVKISQFGQKEWFDVCEFLFQDGVEQMMINASCFVILCHVYN